MDFATLTEHILHKSEILFGVDRFETISEFEKRVSDYPKERISMLNYFKSLGYSFKNEKELVSFVKFISILNNNWGMSVASLSEYTGSFLFDYTIPQISKEFDLLRFGNNYNINIELKSITNVEAQKKQLIKNSFYLNFLPVETKYYSISPETNSFIEYEAQTKQFKQIVPSEFISVIKNQVVTEYNFEEADNLFEIKNYLVSPFNNVTKFLEDKYFLNGHQSDIVNDIVEKRTAIAAYGIKGKPGTGKTLLIYHIAKCLKNMNKKVLIVHGGKLNKGQLELVQNNYNIKPIKEFNEVMDNLKNYDYIIFDEAQRLRRAQIDKLFKKMSKSDCKFIISLDGNQTLGPKESKANAESILDFIKNNDGLTYSLKDKFRSNPEMSEFIKLLMKFSVNSELKKSSNKHNNITIKYFSDKNQAQKYLERMENNGLWTVLNYTRSLHTIESLDRMVDCGRVTHEIIGQEFDNVIIPMDTNFTYKQRNHGGKEFKYLTTTRSYYDLQKMLYQNLTRTKTKLQIVVISNYELFGELCSLLDKL